ncbi:cellulose biosynthesis cyclic di-GMP-binding regulatory protein BcsB [Mycobacterium sp. SMC-4]|uniref:cellulose biosynthesis cyclic di-GMP-binding regulatory protein BcsB n=1 Tax=Mycobacterium sp. SMC-4 TaxID=2857059 RepID=UPI0021B20C7D|nr:cellulose biosynthesis cyclic di-GMP-binding regulatory protein BcsB [Mycobacterium sp. SMC-4]UXA19292.1 cellulose biosynthesis cyclic di-GMP-binding regulatory protein BcsB [Mycobacterium sp. SMC-4]
MTHREFFLINVIRRVVAMVLSLALVASLSAAQVASADPLNSDPAAGPEVGLPWRSLGLPERLTLSGANVGQEFTVPVPSGFSPLRLRGLIHAPIDYAAGFVEILSGTGRFLATVPLPAVVPEQAVVPFDVDISAAQVNPTGMGLSFTVRQPLMSAEDRCGLGQQVMLSDLSAVFTGAEPAPTSIANFFPPVLQRLTIYTPVDADDAEKQAALTLASAVTRLYRPQPVAITVVDQPRGATPPPAPQFTRAVVVERGDAGLTVVNPDRAEVFLRVAGRGNQLSDQAALMVADVQSLVQVPQARVDQAGAVAGAQGDEFTFEELGISGAASVLRTATLTVGVDRAAFGSGRVDGLRMQLLATHTPVAELDSASVSVSVNGQAVTAVPLTETGRLDVTFDVPAEFLRQRISLDFDLTFSPRQLCNPAIAPVAFELDPRSTVTVRRGGDPLGGFGAVPSELAPEFLVAFDGSSPDQLDYAVRAVSAVARLTGAPLAPRVVDVNDAANSSTGALIVANSATVDRTSLRPPVGGQGTQVQVGLARELRADVNRGLGSVQVFADGPRDRTVMLVTTSGAWSLVEPVFDYLNAQPDGLASLTGDVLAAGPDGEVTNLAIGAADSPPSTQDDPGGSRWWLVAAGVLVLSLLAVAAALWWRRRQEPAQLGDSSEPSVSKTS